MLRDFRSYDNLGSPQYYFELLTTLNSNGISIWTVKDVEQLFYNKIINGRRIFDGCLDLASRIEILHINEKEVITINKAVKDFLFTEKQMSDKFIEYLFIALKDDESFYNIFSSQHLSYDIIYNSVQINKSAFSLPFSNFKQLLIDFEVIKIHPTKELNKFIINSRYKRLFDRTVLPEIKKRKIGISELKASLEKKQIHGEEAEKFVLNFETKRLKGKDGISWVAEYSVAEGYDISSYEDENSIMNDRFIEVKSYVGTPYFYWSRNEMNISKIKGSSYYLYLVDRNQMHKVGYIPIIIQNPSINVLKNDKWDKQVENYKIELSPEEE
jgi:Domain of unknown function (DUF3883)